MINELIRVALNLWGGNGPLLPLCQLSLIDVPCRGVREASRVPGGPRHVADGLVVRALLELLVSCIVGGVLVAIREVCRICFWLLLLALWSSVCVGLGLVPSRRLLVFVF